MAQDNEVAQYLGISESSLNEIQKEAYFLNVIKIEEMINESYYEKDLNSYDDDIQNEIEKKDFRENLAKAISTLKEKEQQVMSLYYYEELTLKEIGEILNLTESRVCQIHSAVLNKLKIKLKGNYN